MKSNSTRQIAMTGHFSGQLGVGEVARRLSQLLTYTGFQIHHQDFRADKSASIGFNFENIPRNALSPSALITCVNPDLTGLAYVLSKSRARRAPHIGFWSWEVEDFPNIYKPATDIVDEIWTVSDFAAGSISRAFPSAKVRKITLPVPVKRFTPPSPNTTKSGRKMKVLVSLDVQSGAERKNPLGSVEAYLKAFSVSDGSELVIKVSNSKKNDPVLSRLESLVERRGDVSLINRNISVNAYRSLIESTSVLLSLHRAEGYGLNLIDAMGQGKIVMATGYSGNMDYMSTTNSIPISYKLIPIHSYANVRLNTRWAEPDVEEAAVKLRDVQIRPELREHLSTIASEYVRKHHSLEQAGALFERQFVQSYAGG